MRAAVAALFLTINVLSKGIAEVKVEWLKGW